MTRKEGSQSTSAPNGDAELDALLAEALHRPGDEDIALLSRAVLSRLAEDSGTGSAPRGEVLSEPLPWVTGFGLLLLLLGGLGYALAPSVGGTSGASLSDLVGFLVLIGVL